TVRRSYVRLSGVAGRNENENVANFNSGPLCVTSDVFVAPGARFFRISRRFTGSDTGVHPATYRPEVHRRDGDSCASRAASGTDLVAGELSRSVFAHQQRGTDSLFLLQRGTLQDFRN